MGKTRVAPLKPQTIPKLELQAAVYSCRLQRAFIKNTTLSVSKKNFQHSNCNKRHNTLLHRDFQIAGSSSHLTGRQGFRTNNRNQPLEVSHDKSPSHKGTTASVHVTQKVSTNNCLQRNTEAENYRTETHQPAATF